MFEAVTKIVNEKEPAQYVDDGPVVEMDSWINHATHDIIGLAGLGQDFNSLPDRNTKLNRTYQNIFRSQSAPSALLLVISPIWILHRIPSNKTVKLLRQASKSVPSAEN